MGSDTDIQSSVPPVVRWAVWLIEKVGVPTALVFYLLLSLGPKIDKMTLILETRLPAPSAVLGQK